MKLSQALCVESLVLLIVITGCGGGSGSQTQQSDGDRFTGGRHDPPSGEVTLQATVTGSPGTPRPLEHRRTTDKWCQRRAVQLVGYHAACWTMPRRYDSGRRHPSTSVTVTYHAPSTSGTFHVIAEWSTAFTPALLGMERPSSLLVPEFEQHDPKNRVISCWFSTGLSASCAFGSHTFGFADCGLRGLRSLEGVPRARLQLVSSARIRFIPACHEGRMFRGSRLRQANRPFLHRVFQQAPEARKPSFQPIFLPSS